MNFDICETISTITIMIICICHLKLPSVFMIPPFRHSAIPKATTGLFSGNMDWLELFLSFL